MLTSTTKYAEYIGEVKIDCDEIASRISVPHDRSKIPRIIGWSGPARVGSTALLFLMANHKKVDRLYFQPQKSILRGHQESFALDPKYRTVCMKEVYGQVFPSELYDPVGNLLSAGVPAEKITWIFILREPKQAFASWKFHYPESSIDVFVEAQNRTIRQYHKYYNSGVKVIPFVYDMLMGNEQLVVDRILELVGLDSDDFSLEFSRDAKNKIILGQADYEEYYNSSVRATVEKARFLYARNDYPLSVDLVNDIKSRCDSDFKNYLDLARKELKTMAC